MNYSLGNYSWRIRRTRTRYLTGRPAAACPSLPWKESRKWRSCSVKSPCWTTPTTQLMWRWGKVIKVWMQSSTSDVPVCTTLSVFLCVFFLHVYKMETLQIGTSTNLKGEICHPLYQFYTDSNWSYLLSIKAASGGKKKVFATVYKWHGLN